MEKGKFVEKWHFLADISPKIPKNGQKWPNFWAKNTVEKGKFVQKGSRNPCRPRRPPFSGKMSPGGPPKMCRIWGGPKPPSSKVNLPKMVTFWKMPNWGSGPPQNVVEKGKFARVGRISGNFRKFFRKISPKSRKCRIFLGVKCRGVR